MKIEELKKRWLAEFDAANYTERRTRLFIEEVIDAVYQEGHDDGYEACEMED